MSSSTPFDADEAEVDSHFRENDIRVSARPSTQFMLSVAELLAHFDSAQREV
ncbi:MAG: hypothetical protein ACT4NX_01495 [Deltaproteobacteria bacterium]